MSNAVKFTEVGVVSLITRLASLPDGSPALEFDVVDTGLGMADDQTANPFQPFSQADASTTRRFGGIGLGLAISKPLAEALGGNVQLVRTKLGVGSRFRLTVASGPLHGVPLLDRLEEVPGAEPEEPAAAKVAPPRLAGRILLAEDGPDNQLLITHLLKKYGADVTVVENGQLAVEAAWEAISREQPFGVILMDMQMPVMDGYAATATLHKSGYTRPIIALTAHAMARDRQRCLDSGCDDFCPKPIDRDQLLETVHRHLNQNSATPGHPALATLAPAPSARR